MFRHQGKSRTLMHNLQLAAILSLVAGIVNVCGFLAIHQLTTNVTGHFALFINDVANTEFLKGVTYFAYILSFFLGSFMSSFLIERFHENRRLNVYVIPTLLECAFLISVVVLCYQSELEFPNTVACLLLFAMGLQNSYVTKISNAVVRTTHLTGLFTDLGIELSQLFFPKYRLHREKIKANIKLRLVIISSFFIGGLAGGFCYVELDYRMNTLVIAVLLLLFGLFFDDFKYRVLITRRKYLQKKAANDS
ncbi:YoaK family protein [Algoriphagus jejuensis]|uniref:YoaK family protein n=1 Tax=Algoriphagus jejuensis TaxID=419934 RepID=UPI0031D1260B